MDDPLKLIAHVAFRWRDVHYERVRFTELLGRLRGQLAARF